MTADDTRARLLFGNPQKRRVRRTLMHIIDAGEGSDGTHIVVFACHRCAYRSEWTDVSVAQAKRGLTCPRCSPPGYLP
jgi:hypothetical protein